MVVRRRNRGRIRRSPSAGSGVVGRATKTELLNRLIQPGRLEIEMAEREYLGLHNLHPAPGSRKNRRRVGRGPGSGRGKTASRGEKGQKSRSGYSRKLGFEGGQMPLHRRVPKRGFTNIHREEFAVVNLDRLSRYGAGEEVTPERLVQDGVLHRLGAGLKVLARGNLDRALTVKAHRFSAQAKSKIEAAGGSAVLLQ